MSIERMIPTRSDKYLCTCLYYLLPPKLPLARQFQIHANLSSVIGREIAEGFGCFGAH